MLTTGYRDRQGRAVVIREDGTAEREGGGLAPLVIHVGPDRVLVLDVETEGIELTIDWTELRAVKEFLLQQAEAAHAIAAALKGAAGFLEWLAGNS